MKINNYDTLSICLLKHDQILFIKCLVLSHETLTPHKVEKTRGVFYSCDSRLPCHGLLSKVETRWQSWRSPCRIGSRKLTNLLTLRCSPVDGVQVLGIDFHLSPVFILAVSVAWCWGAKHHARRLQAQTVTKDRP